MLFPDRLKLPLAFDPVQLSQDLSNAVSWGWRAHFNRADYDGGWDVIPLRAPDDARHPAQMICPNPMAQVYVGTQVLERCPYFREVLAAFPCTLRSARLMRLAPGAVIKEHTDGFLDIEDGAIRLHIPVVTNDAVDFRLNRERIVMAPGSVWYLRLSDPHSIANRGTTDRVHLLIDMLLDKWLAERLEEAEKQGLPSHSAA